MRASPLDPPATPEPRAALAAALRCVGLGGAPAPELDALELEALAARLAAAAVVGAATGRSSVLAAAATLVPGAAASVTGTLCTLTNEQACCDGYSACSWTTANCGPDISGSGSDNAGICDGTYTGNILCASAAASRAAGPGRAAARLPRPCRRR